MTPADDDDDDEEDDEEAVDMEGKKIISRYKEQLYIDIVNYYIGF